MGNAALKNNRQLHWPNRLKIILVCNARSGFEIHTPAAHKRHYFLWKFWPESLLKLQEFLLNCEAIPINGIKSE